MTARTSAWALAFFLFAIGCGEDEPQPSPSPGSGGSGSGSGGSGPVGWKAAVGDDGTIVETFADNSWTVERLGEWDLYAVSCVNNEVGWAVGARGLITHTRDGGQSWWPQSSGFTADLLATAFAIDASGAYVGVIAGESGALAVTRDGSISWTAVDTGITGALRGAATTQGATLLLASGDGGVVARSEDQGATWSQTIIAGAGALRDVATDASGTLVLAADESGAIWLSRDRALSFTRETSTAAALTTVSIGHDGRWAVAAGSAGSALLRDASGAWTALDTGTTVEWHAALVAPNGEHFYLAGDAGTLLESQDRGRSFVQTHFSSDVSVALRGIEDLSAR